MYKECKTQQSAARQRELEQCLLQEMLLRKFDEISISDLCDGIGIPRKAFYRYFSGKQGALHALIDHKLADFDRLVLEMGQSRDATQREYLDFYFHFWQEQRPLLDAITRSSLWDVLSERCLRYALNELECTKQHVPPQQYQDGTYLTCFTISGMVSVLRLWHHRGFCDSPEQMSELVHRNLSSTLLYWTN